MRHFIYQSSLLCLLSMLILIGCDNSSILKNNVTPPESQMTKGNIAAAKKGNLGPEIIEGEYIVTFENQFSGRISQAVANQVEQLRTDILNSHNISQKAVFAEYSYAIKGFAAELTDKELAALKKDPRIKDISPNAYFQLHYVKTPVTSLLPLFKVKTASSGETLPWGIARVNGPLNGTGEQAWILGTGIDLDHPDLNVDVDNSASFIAGESANDVKGHGTHVAGILAAINNNRGVVGVAAGASVVAIKVCNKLPPTDPDSGCPVSSIMNGLDYVSTQAEPDDIVNISLGGYDPNETWYEIDQAILNMANNGIRFVISAGNAGDFAGDYTPARVDHQNVWTVSAYDANDDFASFSNYGNPPVDYGGPGVDVPSSAIGGGITTKSGTSMSAPHIAGLLLAASQEVITDGYVNNDPDGNPDPILVKNPPLKVSVSGPGVLYNGEQGTWEATVTDGGDGSYSYQWYYSKDGFTWIADGSDSKFYSHRFTYPKSQLPQSAAVKVVVDDGDEQGDGFNYVFVKSRDCPPHQICP